MLEDAQVGIDLACGSRLGLTKNAAALGLIPRQPRAYRGQVRARSMLTAFRFGPEKAHRPAQPLYSRNSAYAIANESFPPSRATEPRRQRVVPRAVGGERGRYRP